MRTPVLFNVGRIAAAISAGGSPAGSASYWAQAATAEIRSKEATRRIFSILRFFEMIVAAWRERTPFESHRTRRAAQDCPNVSDPARRLDPLRKREQQLIVFAAMESTIDGGPASHWHPVHLGRDPRGETQPVQLERQAVAQIDACRSAARQAPAQCEPRLDAPF